jgi:peptidoglycan/LPS O-acetylase OafA/YrhL
VVEAAHPPGSPLDRAIRRPGPVATAGTRAIPGTDRPRLYFLDNLRLVAILLVIVLHAAITYMAYPPTWWYVLDPHQSVVFTMLVLVVDVPIMPALFFVAGYFALPSLERRGTGGFVREKLVRVGLPWVLGVLFLAPLETYMTEVSRHVPVGYLQFLADDFLGPMYQQSVYWFLGVLFTGFIVLALVYRASPRLRDSVPRIEQPSTRFLVAFIAGTAAGSALLAPAYGIDDWQPLALLVVQPARVAFYIGYFALGVYAERRGWFRAGGFRPEPGPWGWGCVVAGVAYLSFRMMGTPATPAERAFAALLFSVFCLSALLAGLSVFQRAVNGAGRAWRTAAASSYGIYYVHPLILYPLAYLLVDAAVPNLAKWMVLVTVTSVASLAAGALLLRRLPGLRAMF